MSNSNQTQQTWNKVASLYETKFMYLDLYNDSYNELSNLLKPNATILDVGCGPGNITKYLLQKNANFSILGIDYAPNMIELAKKNNPIANFKVLDVNDISTLNKKFDCIISGFQLPYLNRKERFTFIQNCSKLLNDNGIIYLSFVHGKYKDSHEQTGSSGDSLFFHYHDLENLTKELLVNNLNIIKTLEVEYQVNKDTFQRHTILLIKN